MGSRQPDHWMTLEEMEIRKYQDDTGAVAKGDGSPVRADAFLTILTSSRPTAEADPPQLIDTDRANIQSKSVCTTF